MEVKLDYKRTELGVIPEEWDVKPLSEAVDFLDGRRRPVKDSDRAKMRGGIPYYGASGIVDYVNDFLFNEDLILLGEDGENILSRNCRLAFKITGKTWVNNHAHVLRPKPGWVLDYLVEFLESRDYAQFNTGTAQPKLNKLVCSRISVLYPPLIEQSAIAEALSDVDGLLGGLDRLVAKKRDLKQAAMQQLLTGQTRLPGFHGDWEMKKISELATITKGSQLHSTETDNEGQFPHLNGGVSASSYTDKANTPANTIAISEGGNSCGFVQFMAHPYWCGGHCYAVVPKKTDNRFLYHALKGQQSAIMDLRVGSGLPNVQKTALAVFRLNLPADLSEQTAIAAVLTDMDAELAVLEQRREKTCALKQGMMQELLTGRTRLL
jgi:type I restriction enzyme S subunit